MKITASLAVLFFAVSVRAAADSDAMAIVEKYRGVFTAPPQHVPSKNLVDGPILGNGDAAVVVGGPVGELQFFIGKNDFWGRTLYGNTLTEQELADGTTKYAHTKGGGRLSIDIPALKGGSYHMEQYLAKAVVCGTFTKDSLVVRSRSRVDANENLLVTELSCENGETDLILRQQSGPGSSGAAAVGDSDKKVNVGREQSGGGRWYFQGEIADLSVSNKPVTLEEIRKAAAITPRAGKTYDGRTTWSELDAPPVENSVAVCAWIKLGENITDKSVCYIVSKGAWNEAYGLGITLNRRLRWSVNGKIYESPLSLEKNRWIHVAAFLNPQGTGICIDGKPVVHEADTCGIHTENNIPWGYRDGDSLPGCRRIAWASRILGAPARAENNGLRAKLSPGKPVTIVTAISGSLDAADPVGDATRHVLALDAKTLESLAGGHRDWWASFWKKSFIEIPDKTIEKQWYAALYALASCNREGKIPAGLWGWATGDISDWCGGYTLNYNFEAPYFITAPSNHPELERNYFKTVNDFVPKSRQFAQSRGFKGIYFPTGIGPWGWHYGERNDGTDRWPAFADFAQRSNASYLAVNFISHWHLTRDEQFLRDSAYPFLRGVAEFWEDYLKLENGRYVINHDAIHEEGYRQTTPPISNDKNSIVSIALVKLLFRELSRMSETLGIDANKRGKWKVIAERLAPFATQQMNGKTVFRYTEQGKAWHNANTLGIQHIYPACGVGLDSGPELLEISRNTIDAMGRWGDNNGTSTWYSACARVGYDPTVILKKLREQCDSHAYPNLLLRYGGGGIENCGTLAAVNEMLMQSHEGVVRLFPCWPHDLDARFGTLRAYGAFLVSAEIKGGVVSGVSLHSEKGRDCVVQNPWPGKTVRVTRDGKAAETVTGDRFTLKTSAGEVIGINPE